MTLPVFDVIPVPGRSALANEPPPANSQATTVDANFAKVNTYLSTGLKKSTTWSGATPGVVSTDVVAYDGQWHWYFGMEGFSLTVPPNVAGWLLWIDVTCGLTNSSWIAFSPGWSGTGVVGSGPAIVATIQPGGSGMFTNASSMLVLPASTFTSGGTVSSNMRYQAGAAGNATLAVTCGLTAL